MSDVTSSLASLDFLKWILEFGLSVPTPTDPVTCKEDDVVIPRSDLSLTIEIISIFASVVSPLAVVAIPTKFPCKTLKVAIPVGLLMFIGILSLSKVPLLMLDALIPVMFVPNPLNEYEVVIPVTYKFELMLVTPLTFKLDAVVIPVIFKFLPIVTSLVALISPSLAIPTPLAKDAIL